MKKIPAVLTLSAVCMAILFAQERIGTPPATAPETALPEEIQPSVALQPELPEADLPQPAPAEPVDVSQEPSAVPAAEPEEDPAGDEEPVETVEIGIMDDMTAGAEIRGGLISLSLKNVELQDVVSLFSRLSNANIIVPDMQDEEKPRRVDVNLTNVEWRPALKAILDTHGLELVEKIPGSEVYSIRERPADAPEPMEIKVFRLDYATVAEVVKMVEALVNTDGGQISTYPARNSIVAQGTAKLINDLEQIVAAVDLPREQVFIEAKFLELSDSASERLGIDWNVLGGYGIGVGGISGNYSFDKSQTDNINRFRDIAGRSYEDLEDAPDNALWLEDPNNPEQYTLYDGITYYSRPGNDADLHRLFGVTPTMEAIDSSVVGKTLGATLNADDFNLVLSALKEMNGAKVVSNPKIIVANEETASIHIGQKKPNIKGTIQTAGDSQVTRVYALDDAEPYFEDGVRIDVTPTVNTEDNITVRIQPKLDRLDADPTMAPDGTEFWGKSTKTIETVFGLEDGQTAAIGGLTEASKSDVDRKVPLLGDLPFIGRLFSYSSKNSRQVETIIFVTVGMASPASMEFETGLPEDSTLAMRHRAEAATERAINKEEMNILQAVETERLRERIGVLREAEQKRTGNLKK
jgi:type II secretory pathway component GspD/PulD (secretin)